MDLNELGSGVDPKTHWYYRSKSVPLLELFRSLGPGPTDVVDLGAGSGYFSDALAEQRGRAVGAVYRVDSGYAAPSSSAAPRTGRKLVQALEPPETIQNSLILMMDVLEHVEDDAGFLHGIARRCRGENRVFITVPAFMSLWSGHDEFLGHKRRYRLAQLEKLVAGAGVKINASYYIFGAIFPAVWALRRLRGAEQRSDLKPPPPLVGPLLEGLCRAEMPLRRLNRLFGLSCVIEGTIRRESSVV